MQTNGVLSLLPSAPANGQINTNNNHLKNNTEKRKKKKKQKKKKTKKTSYHLT